MSVNLQLREPNGRGFPRMVIKRSYANRPLGSQIVFNHTEDTLEIRGTQGPRHGILRHAPF